VKRAGRIGRRHLQVLPMTQSEISLSAGNVFAEQNCMQGNSYGTDWYF
jgi:hypothetical protein